MASGNRSGYGSWELDKGGELNLDYCDVGLGLKLPWQHHHHQQQQQQQQNQQSSVSWLQNHSENSRSPSPSPVISGFSPFGELGGGRVTFTAIQRQELERQTMIFKYMMASIPIPPDLLISSSKYPSSPISTPSSGRKTGVEMRFGGNRGGCDPEPWRCRRTDGKKWRCSRDVAPDQKYCERHSHKGRPSRSRKPVETQTSIITSSSTSTSSSSSSSSLISPALAVTSVTAPVISTCNPIIFTPFAIPKPSSSFDLPSPPPQFSPLPRYPDWFMKREVTPNASSCLFPQHIGGNETTTTVDDHQSCLLSRPFIDAWSLGKDVVDNNNNNAIDNDNNSNCPTPSSPLNSILPLTLSMSAGIDSDYHRTSEDHTKENPEIRSSSSSTHHQHHHHHHHQPLNWMSSWISSPPGGPLAEALCLGISGPGSGIMSNHSDELVAPHGHGTGSSTTTLG
ncbi:Growth-regulating factor 4 [Bienertia sinuspersici]